MTLRPPEIIFGGLLQGLGGQQEWTMLTLVNGFTQWKERSRAYKGAVRPPQGQELHFDQIYFAVSNHEKHSEALSMGRLCGGWTLNHTWVSGAGLQGLGNGKRYLYFLFSLFAFDQKWESWVKVFFFPLLSKNPAHGLSQVGKGNHSISSSRAFIERCYRIQTRGMKLLNQKTEEP